jgi:hypothetical protein
MFYFISLSDEKTVEREFGALEKINDNYPKPKWNKTFERF